MLQNVILCWAGFAFLTGVIWLVRHAVLSRFARVLPPLRAGAQDCGAAGALPPITVLVAAKDEEENIERCVRSILRQDYPNLSVIAVNDRSGDATGDILDRVAREDVRLKPVHVDSLLPDWFGKNHAMYEGMKRANGSWLCFTDADCTLLSPHALSTAMRYALDNRSDFLSVLPVLETQSILERIMQPACAGILLIWFNPLFVNDPRRKAAYANGAMMLMTRQTYDRIGGHERVRNEVNEDIQMARFAKESGLRLRVVGNDDLYVVRMYSSFVQMWRGWSRIFYGSFRSHRRVLMSMIMVTLVGIQPWATAAVGGLMSMLSSETVWHMLGWSGLFASAAELSVLIRYYRSAKIPAWLAPTYPVAATVALGMLASAIARMNGRGTTTWRGTTYRGEKVVA